MKETEKEKEIIWKEKELVAINLLHDWKKEICYDLLLWFPTGEACVTRKMKFKTMKKNQEIEWRQVSSSLALDTMINYAINL